MRPCPQFYKIMRRNALDIYDDMPHDMYVYISNNGWHFTKKAAEWASSRMRKKNSSGKGEKITPYTKEQVDEMLKKYGIELENDTLYDKVYLANMIKADYLGGSIIDEARMAMHIKETLDDFDASDDAVFRCWVAKMIGKGEPIDWEEIA